MYAYKENTIGEIVETLIRVKDHNRQSLTLSETDAINDACNILYKSFPSDGTKCSLTDENVLRFFLSYEDVRKALSEKGYEPSDANVEAVVAGKKLAESLSKGFREIAEDAIRGHIESMAQAGEIKSREELEWSVLEAANQSTSIVS